MSFFGFLKIFRKSDFLIGRKRCFVGAVAATADEVVSWRAIAAAEHIVGRIQITRKLRPGQCDATMAVPSRSPHRMAFALVSAAARAFRMSRPLGLCRAGVDAASKTVGKRAGLDFGDNAMAH